MKVTAAGTGQKIQGSWDRAVGTAQPGQSRTERARTVKKKHP